MNSMGSPAVFARKGLPATVLLVVSLAVLFALTANAAENDFFPVMVKGQAITVRATTDYKSLVATLRTIFSPEEPSVSTPQRIQYDFIAIPGEGPVALFFDFDKRGKLTGVGIESMLAQQNPVARELAAWLRQTAGPGMTKGKTTTWKHAGFVFRLREVKNAGEDSSYGVSVTRQ